MSVAAAHPPAPPPGLAPMLARLSAQAEAAAAAQAGLLADGEDPIPPAQRAAWARVLTGFAASEGFEEAVMDPTRAGLVARGFDDPEILRFFRLQGEDELRHERLFRAYVERHFGPIAPGRSLGHRVVYDAFMRGVAAAARRHPLRLLVPLLVFEKTGTLYLRRLLAGAGEDLPRLRAVVGAIFRDEARHVAGVGATCRALVAADPPGPAERAALRAICRVVILDMDRKAWWKPGVEARTRALGVDPDAMNADNARVYAEVVALVAGRGDEADDAAYQAG